MPEERVGICKEALVASSEGAVPVITWRDCVKPCHSHTG